jgi:predicted nucleic acid-binding protein
MILADTSVWIDHIVREEPELSSMLVAGKVFRHPMILGELALGTIRNRTTLLQRLHFLDEIPVAQDGEVRLLIERKQLYGRGIGYVDTHLLASVLLAPGAKLWTRDKRLRAAAEELGVAAPYA